MKRKNEIVEIIVIDLTLEDEIDIKSQSTLQSKTKNQRRQKIGLKENAKKFLKRSNTLNDFKVHKLHNFEKMAAAAAANAINHQYAEQLLSNHIADIQLLHQALDVNHTHIPCGDTTEWNNLPNGFKNHFISSKFNKFYYHDYFIGVQHYVPNASVSVASALYFSIRGGIVFTIPHLMAIGRIALIPTVL